MYYWNKPMETIGREDLERIQLERLQRTVLRMYTNVPFYRERMQQQGVKPEDVQSLADLRLLPFMDKRDLRDNYPFGLFAVPQSEIVRIHASSGTTGKPSVAGYTSGDVDRWAELMARAMYCANVGKSDILQVAYGYGLFTGGFGLNGGSQKLGCLTLPMSSGNTDRQLQFMEDLGSTILCCTPSYAAYLAESIHERGLQDKIHLKAGIFGAEAWSEQMRQDIQKSLGIKAYDIYGLTELSGPGVAYECSAQAGMHINEDHFIAEIIDPDTGEVLPEGTQGELVFTSITKQAFPLLRYRTRDICILRREACPCGRTHIKMCKPMGRSDDMLIVKGVNVFPSQIETVLLEQGYTSNYQIVVDRVNNSDTLDVLVEMTLDHFSDSLAEITKREKGLVAALKAMLGIYAQVHLVSPKSIARSEGKAIRVIDKRKI